MPFMPFSILGFWFRGLLSIAILAGGIYLLNRFYNDSYVIGHAPATTVVDGRDGIDSRPGELARPLNTEVRTPARRVFRFDPGLNQPTYELAAGLALVLWSTLGRIIGNLYWMLRLRPGTPSQEQGSASDHGRFETKSTRRQKAKRRKQRGFVTPGPEVDEDPSDDRNGEVFSIPRSNGSIIRVECYGPPDAPPIIWTHGWGASSTEWFYQKRHLTDRFRLILWDIPGLGLSKKPDDNDYRLETLAADLDAVLGFAGTRPAILVGHSIGGMITLTFCKENHEALRSRVSGLVLAHTTYTNPVRTTSMAGFYTAIEKPVIVPLLYLTIALWPLAWLLNWMSYFNGSVHRSTHKDSFSGGETRGQLDFVSRYMPLARPDVLARGMLGMLKYDATAALTSINVPTMVIVGDEDSTTPAAAGIFMAEHINGAQLNSLSPAKHMGLFEHHERFDHLVSTFAETCQPAVLAG